MDIGENEHRRAKRGFGRDGLEFNASDRGSAKWKLN